MAVTWIPCCTHIMKHEHTAGGGDQSSRALLRGPVPAGSWQEEEEGQQDKQCWWGTGRTPSWDSQGISPSLGGHTAPPPHLSAKPGTTLASTFVIWYINEMGTLFLWWIIILMLMLFILLHTHNRVLAIKTLFNLCCSEVSHRRKVISDLWSQRKGIGLSLEAFTPTLPTKCYSDLKKKSK